MTQPMQLTSKPTALLSELTAAAGPRCGVREPMLVAMTFCLLLLAPVAALAGQFVLPPGSVDGKTFVNISFKDKSGGDESKGMTANADGSVTITFDAEAEKDGYDATITFTKGGQATTQDLQLPKNNDQGFNQYEPFKIPEFFAVNPAGPLGDTFDLPNYLASGTDWTIGQIVDVNNGNISQTSTLTFDGFTGQVEMYGWLDVNPPAPASEPSSMLLFGSGILGLGSLLRKRLCP